MKRTLFALVTITLLVSTLPVATVTRSQPQPVQKRRLDLRIHPFADLFFFVYRYSSGSDKVPELEGLAQTVDAAKQVPLVATFVNQLPFELENSAAAAKAFSQFPE